jgi:hypothetical protein
VLDRLLGRFEWSLERLEHARRARILFGGLSFVLLAQLWPAAWSGNEEQYFQLAYRTFAPAAFSPYHAVALDHSLSRAVPLYLIGSAVHWLGYEGAHALWRILGALLCAAGLAYFLSALDFSLWDALLPVMVFLSNEEQLIGGEWLFRSFETKSLGYAALFVAFGALLRERWLLAVLLAAVATYMHFLVGGFWALVILLQQRLETREWRPLLRTGGLYVLLTLPQAALVVWDRIAGAAPLGAPVDLIYASRVPWHVAPFASRREFWNWTWGIAPTIALLLGLGTLWARRRVPGPRATIVLRCALVGLAYLLVALAVAYVDRHTQVLGKFYLFRPSAFTLLLALVGITALVRELLQERAAAPKAILVFVVLVTFTWRTFMVQVDRYRAAGDTIPETPGLVSAVRAHTAPKDVVLLEPVEDFTLDHLRLNRLLDRPTLVVRKFLPTNPIDVLRWDSYVRQRKALFARGCGRVTLPARWLVTFRTETARRLASCGPVVWHQGDVALIRIDR